MVLRESHGVRRYAPTVICVDACRRFLIAAAGRMPPIDNILDSGI